MYYLTSMNRMLLIKEILQKGCVAAILLLSLFSFSGSLVHSAKQQQVVTTELLAKQSASTKKTFSFTRISPSPAASFFSIYFPSIKLDFTSRSFTKLVITKLLGASATIISFKDSADLVTLIFAPRKSIEDSFHLLRG